MKTTLIFLMTLLLTTGGCTKDEHKDTKQENSIYGTWKLVETSGSDGGSEPTWSSVDNGYTYTFKRESNNIISNRFNCDGEFTLPSENTIEIKFNCDENQFSMSYSYELNKGELLLTADLSICPEGCGEKYQMIQTQIKN